MVNCEIVQSYGGLADPADALVPVPESEPVNLLAECVEDPTAARARC